MTNSENSQLVPKNGSGLATASMVLGILSIVLSLLWFIAIILGILAIIFGLISNSKHKGSKSLAGIITGSIGIILSISIMMVVIFMAIPALQSNSRDVARKNDTALLSLSVTEFQSKNAGKLPTTYDLSTTGLSTILYIIGSGTPAKDEALYLSGIDCYGTSSKQAYSITILLENDTEYCLGS